MDYLRHYNVLINKAKTRNLDTYTELHHIVPKCMSGTDSTSNIVKLTPEEHYVAHQLLVKIYPGNKSLIYAAAMMTVGNKYHCRTNNKLYGWLKKRFVEIVKISSAGKSNSQYGTIWIYNKESNTSCKINKDELDLYVNLGWVKGRNLKTKICTCCSNEFLTSKQSIQTCGKYCRHSMRSVTAKTHNYKRPIIDNTGLEFESIKLAAQFHGVDNETIRYRVSTGKYKWKE